MCKFEEMKEFTIVIPTFNNAENCIRLIERLLDTLPKAHIVVIDDGSEQLEWKKLVEHNFIRPIKRLRLSKNFGQHSALMAGFTHVETEWLLTMDDDHEGLIEHIPLLFKAAEPNQATVIYGLFQVKRPWIRSILVGFYRLLSRCMGLNHGKGSGFRLLHKSIYSAISKNESGLNFIDERLRWYTNEILYVPIPGNYSSRYSRYNLRKLFDLGLNKALFSTDRPLKLMAKLGALMAFVNFIIALFILYKKVVHKIDVPGYTSLIVSILFSTGLLLFGLGLLAVYIRQILLNSNKVPMYQISEIRE